MDTKKKWERTRPACGFRRLAEPKRGGFSLSSQKRRRGTGRGGRFSSVCPSLQLSPRSFLAGREGKTPQRLYAEHYWCPTTRARTRERLPRSHIHSAVRKPAHK